MEHRCKNVRNVQGYCRSFPKPNSANLIIWVFFVFVLLPPKTTTIMRSLLFSAIIAPLNPAGFCQNKPPCPTASWKLTSATCPILYPFATSKPAPKLSNLQLCRMWGFHSHCEMCKIFCMNSECPLWVVHPFSSNTPFSWIRVETRAR